MIVMTHGIATDSIYWVLRSDFLGEELEDAKTVRFVRSRVSVSPMADKSSLSEVLPMSQGRGGGKSRLHTREDGILPFLIDRYTLYLWTSPSSSLRSVLCKK